MKRKRHTTEQIIRKLREAEQMEAAGRSAAQIGQKLEISAATLARWRSQFRGMGEAEAKRLGVLEEDGRRLNKAATDLMPEGINGQASGIRVSNRYCR
ncbi:MAG: transposase [Planctomycetes bacterium]|nr:transposase [Planctomycetota bacterium]